MYDIKMQHEGAKLETFEIEEAQKPKKSITQRVKKGFFKFCCPCCVRKSKKSTKQQQIEQDFNDEKKNV